MNLEQINTEYTQLKSSLTQFAEDIKVLEQKVNDLADDKDIYVGKVKEGKRNGLDVSPIEEHLEAINKNLNEAKNNLLQKKDELEQIKIKINVKMAEIQNNPEMLKHLQQIMTKRYNRKLAKLKQEKEEVIGNKDRLLSLKQLVTDHPTLGNNLKGIFSAKDAIKSLEETLNSLSPDEDNRGILTDIQEMREKLATNKQSLMDYIQKNNLNITEKDIDSLTSHSPVINGKGELDLDTTINKDISKLNRQIKGYEKSINHCTIAPKVLAHSVKPTNAPQPSTIEQPPSKPEPPEQKTKWYQFIQRFKNWKEKRAENKKPKTLPSGQPQTLNNNNQSQNNSLFKDSLKYDIVNDALNELEETNMKKTKAVEKKLKQNPQQR